MSLKVGGKGSAAKASFLNWFEREDRKWESGKPAFGFPLFHASPGPWECGNRVAISKGWGKQRETWFWFSSFSTARHFHGPPRFPHALRSWCKRANSLRLASCMSTAAWVSD